MKNTFLLIGLFLGWNLHLFAQYQVNGNGSDSGGDCFELTPDLSNQAGSVWYTESIDLSQSFFIDVDLNFGCTDGNGADGIVFGLQPIGTSVGTSGEGLGFGGITPSLGVEFDTYQNAASQNDPSFDHAAIVQDGNVNHNFSLAGPVTLGGGNVEDCANHQVVINWDAEAMLLEVLFDCSPLFSFSSDIVATVFGGNPNVFWGFTSATGSLTNNQSVCINDHSFDAELEDQEICEGGVTQLSAPEGFDSYSWSPADGLNNANTASPLADPSVTTVYTLIATGACGAQFVDELEVVVNPVSQLVWPPSYVLCEGESLVLNAVVLGATSYQWQDGSTGPELIVSEPGTYWALVEVGDCVTTATTEVSIFDAGTLDLGPDFSLCEGQSVIVNGNVPGADTYLWQDGSTEPFLEVSESGTYSLEVEVEGCTLNDEITIEIEASLAIDLGENVTLCDGETLILDASIPGANYTWSDSSTESTLLVDEAGTYFVNVDLDGCLAFDAITVVYNPSPVLNLGADISICEGEEAVIDAQTSGASYLWSNDLTSPNIIVTEAGDYEVTVTVDGCSVSDVLTVDVKPLPNVDLGDDIILCEGESIILESSSGGDSYSWSTGASSSSISVSESDEYILEISENACLNSDTIIVEVFPNPIVNLGDDVILCPGETIVLDAITAGASSYLWYDGSSNSTLEISEANAVATDMYSVEVNVGDCVGTDEIMIEWYNLPTIDLGNDTEICETESLLLDATTTGAESYLWQDGSTNSTFEVDIISANANGLYSVEVLVNGCLIEDEIEVILLPLPAPDLGVDLILCEGESVELNSGIADADSYLWQDGSTSPTFMVSSSNASPDGIYTVLVTTEGCSSSDEVELSFLPIPFVDLGPDTSICEGESYVIDASSAFADSYLWQDGNTGSSFEVSSSNTSADGIYSLVITTDGCSFSTDIAVTINPLPLVDLGSDISLCSGESTTIDLGGFAYETILWQDGSTASSYAISESSLAADGIVSVEVSINSCLNSSSLLVEFIDLPIVDLGPDVVLCEGEDVLLNAEVSDADATYLWHDGSTNSSFLVNQLSSSTDEMYSVVVSSLGCNSSDNVSVSFNSNPSIDFGPSVFICEGESFTIDASSTGADSYLWHDGSTGSSFTVTEDNATIDNQYSLIFTSGLCEGTGSLMVEFIPNPMVDLGPDLELCPEQIYSIDASSVGADSYLWQNGSTDSSLEVSFDSQSSDGFYEVEFELNGCSGTDQIEIQFLEVPDFDLGVPVSLCPGESYEIDASLAGGDAGSYGWQDGSSGPAFIVSEGNQSSDGLYTVEYLWQDCFASSSIEVSFIDLPEIDLGPPIDLCFTDSVEIEAFIAEGDSYLWQDGSTNSSLVISSSNAEASGIYSVEIEINGCTITAETEVNFYDEINFDLGPDLVLCPGETVEFDAYYVYADSYIWQDGSTDIGFVVSESSVADNGWHVVSFEVNGCLFTDSVNVVFDENPEIDLGGPFAICEGESYTVDAFIEGATYYWWTGGSNSSSFSATETGLYSVTIQVNNCFIEGEFELLVNDNPSIDLGEALLLCPEDSVLLEAENVLDAEYLWSTGDTVNSFYVGAAGWYNLELSQNGCTSVDSIQIVEGESANIDLGPDLEFCEGEEVLLDATSFLIDTYDWQTGEDEPIISVSETGVYVVEGSFDCGIAIDSIQVNFIECETDCPILIPTAFSPNGDGSNDFFNVVIACDVEEFEFSIFNRWGQKVFSTLNQEEGWDGVFKGESQEIGVYAWTLNIKDSSNLDQEVLRFGNLTLIK